MDTSKSFSENQPTNAPRTELPPDAEERVILVCSLARDGIPLSIQTGWSVFSILQEARKEGVFAGLTSGLASGEHSFSHNEASRVVMSNFYVP